MKKTGGDFFTLTEIRAMLREANTHFDGAGELAFIQEGKEAPELRQVAVTGQEPVVVIPGDGLPFPERAYAEALRVAPVIVERE